MSVFPENIVTETWTYQPTYFYFNEQTSQTHLKIFKSRDFSALRKTWVLVFKTNQYENSLTIAGFYINCRSKNNFVIFIFFLPGRCVSGGFCHFSFIPDHGVILLYDLFKEKISFYVCLPKCMYVNHMSGYCP